MIKYLVSLLLLCTSSLHLFSQKENFFTDYYPFTEQAAMLLLEGRTAEALEQYQQAFAKVEHAFAIDYYHALLCANDLDQFDLAFEYLHKLVAKGIEKDFFEQAQQHFSRIIYDPRWEDLMDEYAFVQQQHFGQTVNYQLKGVLGELLHRDQETRVVFREDKTFDLRAADILNINTFMAEVDKTGFPSEELIGIRYPYYTRNDLWYYVLWHHIRNLRTDSSLVDIRPLIKEAMQTGKLYINDGIRFLNFADQQLEGGKVIDTAYGTTSIIGTLEDPEQHYLINYTEEQLKTINENRSKLGLLPYASYQKRQTYLMANGGREHRYKFASLYWELYPEIVFKKYGINLNPLEGN